MKKRIRNFGFVILSSSLLMCVEALNASCPQGWVSCNNGTCAQNQQSCTSASFVLGLKSTLKDPYEIEDQAFLKCKDQKSTIEIVPGTIKGVLHLRCKTEDEKPKQE